MKPWSFLYEDRVKVISNIVKNNSLDTVHEKRAENYSSKNLSSKVIANSIDRNENSDIFNIKDRISFEV